ncbi:DUF2786 domain-containing protein [Afipia carboxidovorans]|uniref:DUF2786 domain-containing protein n=1 Tax=Afipia carboxidovorans TaxID=40137 RepID=UPI00308E9FF8|nr:hypothetical protein CRBSH125_21360 [Afipia carboxidovorans]
MTKKPSARELPLVKRRIATLLGKTEANGCTPGEADAATKKARELVKQYKLDPGAFQWPQTPSATETEPTSEPSVSKPPRTAVLSRGKGIGKLAERLIVEHPEWTHAQIAEEVNRHIDGAKATGKSIRWYASRMRKQGQIVPTRRRKAR